MFGAGGYVSGPMLLAARARACPGPCSRSTPIWGSANRLAAPLVERVYLSFPIEGRSAAGTWSRADRYPPSRPSPARSGRPPLAGLDGIKNKIEPPTPVDKDLYELPPDELADDRQVPASLDAVLDTLERDHEFLTAGGVFTADLIETWIDYKRTQEIHPVQLRPHPHEFELYYDI